METEIGRAIDALQTDQRLKQSNVFLEYNKVEIVAEWTAEAFVTIGKWAGFCGEGVASALVPGDECVADVDDGHLNSLSTVLFHEVFCGGQELAAQLSLLLIGSDGKKSQIPDVTLLRIEQNGSKQRTVWFVAVRKWARGLSASSSRRRDSLRRCPSMKTTSVFQLASGPLPRKA
jgi:hypothetical protein